MSNLFNNKDQNNTDSVTDGATGVAKTGTGILGDTLSGVTNTVGGAVGGASRGLGETVSGVTGQAGKPLGDGVANVGTSLEGTGQDVGKAARDAGQWKSN
ncbi:hypothetical protein M406DRAFT_342551 [Cryphonectria parasitica EP155]|uniref:Uncharacterized protein n=1 Tax=Cryphonectria parasitica (strain ATCC 38755 / EP155) TaxID=660469 RepID=A0A9P5CKA7_CRYP1|nr:uncharacterized protein M406DRAFT_342551 [Cryphonectria parasitica EP155]KAF3761853.1 hypothetical protein M406DRAFT_342551 [Cryphonectria parasitica EP155]